MYVSCVVPPWLPRPDDLIPLPGPIITSDEDDWNNDNTVPRTGPDKGWPRD